jgi:hypothetical protein
VVVQSEIVTRFGNLNGYLEAGAEDEKVFVIWQGALHFFRSSRVTPWIKEKPNFLCSAGLAEISKKIAFALEGSCKIHYTGYYKMPVIERELVYERIKSH